MKKLLLTTLIASGTLCHGLGVDVGIGTTGYGLGVTLPIGTSDFSVKLGASHIQFDTNAIDNHNLAVKLLTADLLLDYKLFGGLSVNAGTYYIDGDEKFTHLTVLKQGQSITDNHTSFSGFQPYAGLSYKANLYKGWYIDTDLGATMFQGNNDMMKVSRYGVQEENTVFSSIYPVMKVNVGFEF